MTFAMSYHSLIRAEARWNQILVEHPDLACAIDLQRALVTELISVSRALDEAGGPSPPISRREASLKLAVGVPAFRGESIELPLALLAPLLPKFCDRLAQGGAGDAALHIAQLLREGRIDTGSLLEASLARDQTAIRSAALHHGLSADMLWLVGELGVAAFAHALQRELFSGSANEPPATFGTGPDGWSRGYCFACGSWPALAAIVGSRRTLLCSFCAAAWTPQSCHCIYCTEMGDAFVLAAPDLERPGRRLELCGTCGSYLKTVDVDQPVNFPLVTIEDLATIDLDLIALQRGYLRPSLPEIATPLRLRKNC